MNSLLAFRPASTLTIDLLLDVIKLLLRERAGPIVMPRKAHAWRKDRVVWSYLADGSIKFELEKLNTEGIR